MKKISVTLLFAFILLTSSCGGGGFFNSDDTFEGIRLTLVDAGNNDTTLKHPSTLHSTYATNVIDSLHYKISSSGEINRIFDKKDVQDIASRLIASFQQVGDEEKILFIYYGKSARETKGFTYIDKDGNWNWVFQKINAVMTEDSWDIYTGKYFRYKTISTLLQGDVVKKNWVLTNNSIIPETVEGVAGVTLKKTLKPQNSYNSQKELKRIKDSNERLRFLKKLFESGYIAEDDYEEQKQRILDRM